jgi:hypothetical protein
MFRVDPRTGVINSTHDYSQYWGLTQIIVDEVGEPILLAREHVIHGDDVIELPGIATQIDYNPAIRKSVTTIPGPDCLTVVDWGATTDVVDGSRSRRGTALAAFCEPNPCSASATIRFYLPAAQQVSLRVLDVTGREVARLADRPFAAGRHTLAWQTGDAASGVYFYRLEAGEQTVTRKLLLVR